MYGCGTHFPPGRGGASLVPFEGSGGWFLPPGGSNGIFACLDDLRTATLNRTS